MIAMTMQVDGVDPPVFIRVLATEECIIGLDPSGAVDKTNALDVAQGDRMRIESAASEKFDKISGAAGASELTLGPDDLP